MGLRSIGDLLEYPVIEVGVLGLWSFISGGTVGGARQRSQEREDRRREWGRGVDRGAGGGRQQVREE